MGKNKLYAVKVGRNGEQIYDNWPECQADVSGFYGARHKSFPTREAAQAWLASDAALTSPTRPPAYDQDTHILYPSTTYSSNSPSAATSSRATMSRGTIQRPGSPLPSRSSPIPASDTSISATVQRLYSVIHDMENDLPSRKRRKLDDSLDAAEDTEVRYAAPSTYAVSDSILEARRLISRLAEDLGVDVGGGGLEERRASSHSAVQRSVTRIEEDNKENVIDLTEMPPSQVIDLTTPPSTQPSRPTVQPPPAPVQQEIRLSEEQLHVLDLVKAGKSVFFTGSAGTGKSVLLQAIVAYFRKTYSYEPDVVAVTSTTGISGVNIGGSTIHSWAGIQLGKDKKEHLAEKIGKSRFYSGRWKATRVLIIDEISMMDGDLFDKLEYIGRVVRKDNRPFGGLQLVLSGDFFQLPPVPDTDSFGRQINKPFAFDSLSWPRCIDMPIVLSKVFRQRDSEFVAMLNRMKTGQLDAKTIEKFKSLSRPVVYTDGIEASLLFPIKAEVDGYNNKKIAALPGEPQVYRAVDSYGWDIHGNAVPEDSARKLLDRQIAVSQVPLKVGAQVMLIRNIVQGKLVNGSLGVVTEFLTVREAKEKAIEVASANKDDDMSHLPPDEQMRRARLRSTTVMAPTKNGKAPAHETVYQTDQRYPVVRFENGMQLLCSPIDFEAEGLRGNVEARRVQVPLILAWAVSIHKSQGQTLSRVKVDLRSIFENGQAYVALSRARDLENLEVLNFDPGKIKVHSRVVAWTKEWMTPEQIRQNYGHDFLEQTVLRNNHVF